MQTYTITCFAFIDHNTIPSQLGAFSLNSPTKKIARAKGEIALEFALMALQEKTDHTISKGFIRVHKNREELN